VAVSTTLVSPDTALPRSLSIDIPTPLAGLILVAAGMSQRWRQQTRQTVQLVRSKRAQKLAQAKRAKRDQLPPASRSRSQANFEMLSLESRALALTAEAAGDDVMAKAHAAEADWFAAKAKAQALWDEL
jgi:hypothetical protein